MQRVSVLWNYKGSQWGTEESPWKATPPSLKTLERAAAGLPGKMHRTQTESTKLCWPCVSHLGHLFFQGVLGHREWSLNLQGVELFLVTEFGSVAAIETTQVRWGHVTAGYIP